jgi:uncharacterized protein (TIGR01440 family)
MKIDVLGQELQEIVEELISVASPKAGQVLVVGCSTSEVGGKKIGTAGSLKIGEELFNVLNKVTKKHKLFLAVQCCEHLNRALVVEQKAQDKYNWEEVSVKPIQHAGGSLGTAAYAGFANPVMVEEVTAHLGLDIGQTLIGMHLKRVAVPVRLSRKKLGSAIITAARTRPPLIGGERAVYK